MRARTPALVSIAIAVVLGGCGGTQDTPTANSSRAPVSGDQRAILETVDSLQVASRRGDGEAICRTILTTSLARSISAASDRTCAAEVRRNVFSPDATISVERDIRIRGNAATAVIREQNGKRSTISILKQDGRWRVDGLTPRTGR